MAAVHVSTCRFTKRTHKINQTMNTNHETFNQKTIIPHALNGEVLVLMQIKINLSDECIFSTTIVF
jgi:hypothetical protein